MLRKYGYTSQKLDEFCMTFVKNDCPLSNIEKLTFGQFYAGVTLMKEKCVTKLSSPSFIFCNELAGSRQWTLNSAFKGNCVAKISAPPSAMHGSKIWIWTLKWSVKMPQAMRRLSIRHIEAYHSKHICWCSHSCQHKSNLIIISKFKFKTFKYSTNRKPETESEKAVQHFYFNFTRVVSKEKTWLTTNDLLNADPFSKKQNWDFVTVDQEVTLGLFPRSS